MSALGLMPVTRSRVGESRQSRPLTWRAHVRYGRVTSRGGGHASRRIRLRGAGPMSEGCRDRKLARKVSRSQPRFGIVTDASHHTLRSRRADGRDSPGAARAYAGVCRPGPAAHSRSGPAARRSRRIERSRSLARPGPARPIGRSNMLRHKFS